MTEPEMTPEQIEAFESFCTNATKCEQDVVAQMDKWDEANIGPDSALAALLCVAEQLIIVNNLPPEKVKEIKEASHKTAIERLQSQNEENDSQDN
tara:strand:+ start:902 stop:1186 length:285 start_codon:yes stop_codon:yes gene_type:complete